jgi:raffinose/stachyose/melibiose transport system permease protein
VQQLPTIPVIEKLKRVSSLPRRFQGTLMVSLFLMPALILFLIFVIYPIFRSVYYSMFDWNGLGPAVDFVGLQNFIDILTDQVFIKAVVNVFVIILFSLAVQLPLALALAVMVGRKLPGRGLFRTIFFAAV